MRHVRAVPVCAVAVFVNSVCAADIMSDVLIMSDSDVSARLMLRAVSCGFLARVMRLQTFTVRVRVSFVGLAARVRL